MKRLYNYLIILALLFFSTSCLKNELTLSGSLSDAEGQSVTMVYRAADKVKSFIVETAVPMAADGSFSFKAATRYPTVIWILNTNTGEALMPVYAERGDELTITGKFNEPVKWKVEGNKVMEQYCEWAAANINALMSNNPGKVNDAIADYIKEHPDSRTAAFLLFTRFVTVGYEAQYHKLLASLTLDEDDLKEMKEACMAPEVTAPGSDTLPEKIALRAAGDSVAEIRLKGSPKLLLFWRESPDSDTRDLLKMANGKAITVFMDNDTIRWKQMLDTDTVLKASKAMQAPGGEVNNAVKTLGVPTTPYFIVSDGAGKISYRGTDAQAASKQITK
ncbi:MAG: DUF4369 domain-containing protein [Prevotella sp.]|nr:DUF4369 domain-containing protein [Prevotella sp.]MCM1074485.1 DUF4369 domain-containing protein [Ruminococcus sp.]